MSIKGREWKQDQFAQLEGFGKGKGRYSPPGINANRLLRGERVRIVCKTKYKARASASDGVPVEANKASKKKAPKKSAEKKTKAAGSRKTATKKKKSSAKDVVEDVSDAFDDDVVIIPPPATTTEYPLIPERKSSRRCVVLSVPFIVLEIAHTIADNPAFWLDTEFLKITSRHLPNYSRIGAPAFVTRTTSCRTISFQLRVSPRLPMQFRFRMQNS
ncbi:unnamed protein product [Phytophthora fragariaefolia]|uniref:Unnamed protein product n=1 Tax=Phytophthora fragariaefolia TaxID=1490495 RepID=A0A9W6XU13_9STRA|nr:unnamed protein product [Phytophthora fragariaefolia]